MARNAIKSYFRAYKMAAGDHLVNNLQTIKFRIWPEMLSKVNFGHPKWLIDLKWPELLSKVNFRYPKLPIDLKSAAILYKELTKIKIVILI